METRDKPLRVLCRGWVEAGFGVRLMGRLHVEASACVVQSRAGELALTLFDSYAPAGAAFCPPAPEGARITLYSNHPAGNMEPTQDDFQHLACLPEGTGLVIVCGSRCVRWEGGRRAGDGQERA